MANPGGSITIDKANPAATVGALIDLDYDPFDDTTAHQPVHLIRTIGASSIVISGDPSRRGRPLHNGWLPMYYRAPAKYSIPVADVNYTALQT